MRRSRLAIVPLLCWSLLGSATAEAYCLEQSNPGERDQVGCALGGADSTSLFWPGTCVGFRFSNVGVPFDFDLAQSIAARVFRDWMSPTTCLPSITVVPLEPTSNTKAEYNPSGPNENLIVFRDHGWENSADLFAFTTLTFDQRTGAILDADIELNSEANDFTPEMLELSLQHEAGHFLGLDESDDRSAIMYPVRSPDDPPRELAQDDEDGICSIYAETGTRLTYSGMTVKRVAATPCALQGAEGCEDLGVDHGCSVPRGPTRAPASALVALGVAGVLLRVRRRRLH